MAPRIKHPEGTFDMHFKVPLDKYKAYMAILHDEGKTQTEDLGEFVIHRVEQKRIEQNPVPQRPVSKNISCLGYTPKAVHEVQQKIDDNIIEENDDGNPNGIPILSSNRQIRNYVNSQEIRSVNDIDSRLKVWNTQTKNRLIELRQALAYQNKMRARA